MKKRIKKILIRLITPLANRLGIVPQQVVVTKKQPEEIFDKVPLLHTFYSNLKQFGYQPVHFVDVGANHGTWTREALKYFPDAYYTLLEPQYWLQNSVNDILTTNKKVTFHTVGAGAVSGNFKFTIHDRDDSCSFVYPAAEAAIQGFKQIELPVVTLNEFLADSGLPSPDIIKIDAEGSDLEVLKGASNYLGVTEVFMVEAGVVNKEFNNSFYKIINFMEANGYRLFDLTDLNRPFQPPVLWLVELVFVRKGGIIDSKKII